MSTPSPNADFSGKTVMVTGATQNLGFTIATHFARAGARTIIHGLTLPDAESACERILGIVPDAEVHPTHFALEDLSAIESSFDNLSRDGLLPDILVNNAAHLGLGNSGFLEQTPEYFREVVDVNLIGTFRCSQLAALGMKARGQGGVIINITSLAGERAIWGRTAYCASKAALEGLTRAMSLELAQFQIRVNAISAGYIWTTRWEALTPEQEERRRQNIPARAPTQQDEIAHLTLFMASDRIPSLIGERVVIDGGLNVQQLPWDVTG